MSHRVLTFLPVLALVMVVVSCGSAAPEGAVLGQGDAGRTAEVRAGGQVEVSLPGNPTTGYQWEVDSVDPAVLQQVGEPEFKPDSDAIGAGGRVMLRFKALAAGQTTLRLIYHRSFEPDEAPLETYEVTVVVR